MPANLGPVIYQLVIGNRTYSNNPPIIDCNIKMSWGRHDECFLRIEVNRGKLLKFSSKNTWADGVSVGLIYGRTPNLEAWYGYINHSEVTNNADSGSNTVQITYHCIGTSTNMNQVNYKNWQNCSPTYVAKQIAQDYNLRAVVTPIGVTFENEFQNCSDFKFLNYIANKYGLRFWVGGGTLYMISPIVGITNASGTIPQFQSNKFGGSQDTLRDFEIIKGQNIPGGVQANRAVFGFDLDTSLPYSAVSPAQTNSSRVAVKQDVSPLRYEDAFNQANAWSALNQWWVVGKALVFGNTSLYPGKVISLVGGALPANEQGKWMISSAQHNLMSSGMNQYFDKYTVSLEVVRNSGNGLNLTGTLALQPELTTCRLASGVWWSDISAPVSQAV